MGTLLRSTAWWSREFELSDDVFAQDSIDFLKNAGIDFARNQAHGIDVQRFGELLMMSGIVLNDRVQWVTFQGGYDFGYLLKIVTCQPLPNDESAFFERLKVAKMHLWRSSRMRCP